MTLARVGCGRIVGHVSGPEPDAELPWLAVRVTTPDGGAVLADSWTLADGAFALEVLAGDVVLRVLDGAGTLLAEQPVAVPAGAEVAVDLAVAVTPETQPAVDPRADRPFVDAAAVAGLRTVVGRRVEAGQLPESAVTVLEAALRPLEWMDSLRVDADAALRGDADASGRLRTTLLGLSTPGPNDEPVEVLTHDHESQERASGEASDSVTDATGLLPLTAAAVHIAATPAEAQAMLDGLAAAVWSRPWVDALARAASGDDPVPMQTMMGGLPPGGLPEGGLPGGGLPGGGLPGTGGGGIGGGGGPDGDWGLPGGPGWAHVPGKKRVTMRVGPTVADLVPSLRAPLNQMPTPQERCLVGATTEVAMIVRSLPRYAIRSFDNPAACPGQRLVIRGEHFGATGLVVFPGHAAGVKPESWTDTAIEVIVPSDAAPGTIRLSILEAVLARCGRLFTIYRPGDTFAGFAGGVPQVLSLWIDGVEGDNSAAPETDVNFFFQTTEGPGSTATLRVTGAGGAVLFQTPALPGGVHSVTFRAPPAPTKPVELQVTLTAQGACGATARVALLTIAYQPDLRIMNVEVTQAIQHLDNSVRLAAHRRTLVRLYLTNGLSSHPSFSYGVNPGELPGVTGSITLWRGSTKVAVVSPSPGIITSGNIFFPYVREDLRATLNFVLPSDALFGPMRLEARVWLAAPPHGVLDGPATNDVRSTYVTFETTNHVRLVQVLLRDDWRSLAAPPMADYMAALRGAQARIPIPDDGWEVYLPPGSSVIGTNHDLTTEDGWEFVLEDIDDIAEDTSNAWSYAWTGVIAPKQTGPMAPNITINGIGRKGNGTHDYPACACQADLPATFAHELLHVFGYGHAGCPAYGDGRPDNVDSSLPQYIEDTGVDVYAMTTYSAGSFGAGEIMSYCGGSNRWTSVVLWTKLMDLLKV
jgi:hypothetical protein